jgi:hypothetical protein
MIFFLHHMQTKILKSDIIWLWRMNYLSDYHARYIYWNCFLMRDNKYIIYVMYLHSLSYYSLSNLKLIAMHMHFSFLYTYWWLKYELKKLFDQICSTIFIFIKIINFIFGSRFHNRHILTTHVHFILVRLRVRNIRIRCYYFYCFMWWSFTDNYHIPFITHPMTWNWLLCFPIG